MAVDPNQLRVGPVEIGTRCNVYRNLNLLRHGVVGWSVQIRLATKKQKVQQHARCVLLSDVTFKHANAAQIRRCQEEAREVCAWVKGTFQGSCLSREDAPAPGIWKTPPTLTGLNRGGDWRRLRCDPKKGRGDFHDDETKRTVEAAAFVFVDSEGAAWYMPQETTNGSP